MAENFITRYACSHRVPNRNCLHDTAQDAKKCPNNSAADMPEKYRNAFERYTCEVCSQDRTKSQSLHGEIVMLYDKAEVKRCCKPQKSRKRKTGGAGK